ncbi:MAG: energy transducer TonB [Gemmatimonadota bacterium]
MIEERHESRRSQGERRQRRALASGMGLSVLLHAALIFGFRGDLEPLSTTVAAGQRAGDPVAAAGGGILQAMNIALPNQIEVPPPPEIVPDLDEPELEVTEPPEERLSPSRDLASATSFPGNDRRVGVARAVGRGDAGADAEGLYRVTAPEPRSIIPEWDPPREVKGMQVMVRVLVDERGAPLGDVELRPPTPNRGFNKRLREKVLRMDYKPARRQGRAISGWAEMTFIF